MAGQPVKRPRKKPEEALTYAAARCLGRYKRAGLLEFTHVPNEGQHKAQYRHKQAQQGVLPGVPDFLVWLSRARLLQLELKAASGRSSPGQKAFARSMLELNHHYEVLQADSPAQLVALIEATLAEHGVTLWPK